MWNHGRVREILCREQRFPIHYQQLSAQSDRHCFLCISTVCSTQHQPRILYHCHQVLQRIVTHLFVSGKPFDSEDWNRLTEVASGNSSSTTTGYFGVGFYSVFTMIGRPRVLFEGSVAVLVSLVPSDFTLVGVTEQKDCLT